MRPPIIDAPFFGFHPGLGCIFTSEGSGAADKKEKPPDASRTKRLAMKNNET